MADKDLGEGLDKLDEEIENLKNKEFRILGVKVTYMTVTAAVTVVSTVVGGLYGAFTVYNDYMDMKEQIQSYVAPDLSGFQEQLSVLDQRVAGAEDAVVEARDYARDIRLNLKADVDRLEALVDENERLMKALENSVRDQIDASDERLRDNEDMVRLELRSVSDDVRQQLSENLKQIREEIAIAEDRFQNQRDRLTSDNSRELKDLEDRLNTRLQYALDNPLAN